MGFLDLAGLAYDGEDSPERRADAVAPTDPTLAEAAALGRVADAVRLLADGADVDEPAGTLGRTPLLHLAFSRIPQDDALATAVALLDAGASPHATWGRWHTPFTPLTGCFGHGESGPGRQPPHPDGERLARLLLARGADPADEQTLYNRMFARSDDHLHLLLEHGLDDARLLGEQHAWALDHGYTDRVELLAAHPPVRRWPVPDAPILRVGTPAAVAAYRGDLDELVEGQTALHRFAWLDDAAMVRALLDAGADPAVRDAVHGTTALAWAQWSYAEAAAAVLSRVTPRSP